MKRWLHTKLDQPKIRAFLACIVCAVPMALGVLAFSFGSWSVLEWLAAFFLTMAGTIAYVLWILLVLNHTDQILDRVQTRLER